MTDAQVDLGWVPPLVYVIAARGGHVQPVAKFVRHGRSDYHSAFIVRAGSPARTLRDLQGKRMAWIDPRSSAGYLFPRAHLARAGVDPDRFFSHQAYLGSHRRVVEAVLEQRADVGVTFFSPREGGGEIVISAWRQYYPQRAGEIRVLQAVGPIPSDVIAVRKGIPDDVRRRIEAIFVKMHEDPDGRELLQGIFNAERAMPARHADYGAVEQMARTLRLE
jgi:phosphate/phosphite/phosphonate ABC transporter binding protein